ncbi:MAG: hypothetical protein CSB47_03815 [Proteobacteria bacterium]|nr:MAG: hypothetical protein CSB47_03815 [Pseudomonadota bacterium]
MMVGLSGCQSDKKAEIKEKAKIKYDCSVSKTLAAAQQRNSKPWEMSEKSQSGTLTIKFSCATSPFVGDFQQCDVRLKHNNKARFADAISIDGGMKAHGHGLPTAPLLSPTAEAGHYKLEGLKYSMPGAWTVGFLVKIDGQSEQVVFDFTI